MSVFVQLNRLHIQTITHTHSFYSLSYLVKIPTITLHSNTIIRQQLSSHS